MKLNKRLNALYEAVDDGAVVADIGCDHAQLCIQLILNGKCKQAYACDLNEGPLKQAKKNIEYYKLQDKIIPCLSNGLAAVNDDVTVVVIAGMGFETIQSILEAHPKKLDQRKFIIQSNTDVEKLRKWISNHHYKLLEERVVYDEHYYQILSFNCEYDDPLTESEIRFGRKMIRDFAFYSMWKYRLSKYEKILRGLEEQQPRHIEILKEMHFIYETLGS